jgi:hypothetical protein
MVAQADMKANTITVTQPQEDPALPPQAEPDTFIVHQTRTIGLDCLSVLNQLSSYPFFYTSQYGPRFTAHQAPRSRLCARDPTCSIRGSTYSFKAKE